jgi:hypothetical protein
MPEPQNGKGEFDNAKVHAPRTAYPGQHWVTALEQNNDQGAQKLKNSFWCRLIEASSISMLTARV